MSELVVLSHAHWCPQGPKVGTTSPLPSAKQVLASVRDPAPAPILENEHLWPMLITTRQVCRAISGSQNVTTFVPFEVFSGIRPPQPLPGSESPGAGLQGCCASKSFPYDRSGGPPGAAETPLKPAKMPSAGDFSALRAPQRARALLCPLRAPLARSPEPPGLPDVQPRLERVEHTPSRARI